MPRRAGYRYGALTCIKQRFDNVTTNCKQKVGLLRNKFLGQFREARRFAVGITVNDLDITAVNEPALRQCIFQRLIDRPQGGIAEYEPSNPNGLFLSEDR